MSVGSGDRYLQATTGFISTSWYCGGNKVWKCYSVDYINNWNQMDQFIKVHFNTKWVQTKPTNRNTQMNSDKQNRLEVYRYNVVMLKWFNTRSKPQTTSCLCVKLNGYRIIDDWCHCYRDMTRWNPTDLCYIILIYCINWLQILNDMDLLYKRGLSLWRK